MKAVEAIGRVLFALIFIAAAPRHFTAEAIAHATDLGTPAAAWLVPLSGLVALAGGLSIAIGYRTRVGACLLLAFLIPVTAIMHSFWTLETGHELVIQRAMFAKNISMIGAALILLVSGAGRWSVDGRLAAQESRTILQQSQREH